MLNEFRSTYITWDKATRRIYSPISANGSDSNGRKLNIQVVNSGQVENLTGATLHLYWETKDKSQHGLDAFTASDISKGEFEIFYTTGMLSNVGELNATLVLVDATGQVVSDWFKITVSRGIDSDAIQSENSFTTLTQALIDISNLEQNYAPRLNDLTAQLQQTEQELNAQLAQKIGGGVKLELEDASANFLAAMSGQTEFNLLSIPQNNSVSTPKVIDKAITPEKTSFAKRGKNKFDGNFLSKRGLLGSYPNYQWSTSANGVSILMEIESGRTYTVTKSQDTNRFGVAVSKLYPNVGDYISRAINESTSTPESVTFTAAADEKYLMVYVSNDGTVPSILQVEEGLKYTGFSGYAKTIISLENGSAEGDWLIDNSTPGRKIVDNTLTAVQTNFAELNRNLYTGEYVGLSVAGSSTDGFMLNSPASGNPKTAVFKGVPGQTYTLTRKGSSDRFGLFTAENYPQAGNAISRLIKENLDTWTKVTVTLGSDEQYILAYVSSPSQGLELDELQIEIGDTATPYEPIGTVRLSAKPLQTKKFVYMGDSIGMLRNLPDLIADKIDATVTDASFSGASLGERDGADYNQIGVKHVLKSVLSGNYSELWNAIVNMESNPNAANKRPNYANLTSLDWSKIDGVIILAGTNDYGNPYGTLEDFEADIRGVITDLNAIKAGIQIYFVTPLYRSGHGSANAKGYKLSQYVDSIVKVAGEYSYPAKDMLREGGINQLNQSVYLRDDLLHQNDTGDILLSEKISRFILSN